MSEALMGNPFYDNPTFTKSKFDSEKRKWEFRYNNQKNTIRELEETASKLRKTIKKLKEDLKAWEDWKDLHAEGENIE